MIEISHAQAENVGLNYVMRELSPASPYGQARVKRLRMYGPNERQELLVELQNTARLFAAWEGLCQPLDKLARFFMQLKDIRRTAERCREAALNELELFELKRFLLQLQFIAPLAQEITEKAELTCPKISALPDALALLSGGEGDKGATFFIPDNRSPALAAARKKKRELELAIRTEASSSRLVELKAQRTEAAAAEDAEESRLRAELSADLRPYLDALSADMEGIAELDFTVAKAEFARRFGGVLPELSKQGGELAFTDMVNTKIAESLAAAGRSFTPISIRLSPGAAVVTGANMGGKSVALKTLALNVLMAHAGILPTAGSARLPLLSGLFMVSEDLENTERGLSSFGAEIVRFNEVLSAAQAGEGQALIMLDEFARGTNPFEGASIVKAAVAYLDGLKHYSMITTHYDGVSGSASRHYQVIGLRDMDLAGAKERIAKGEDGVKVIAACMDYGLFEVGENAPCPRDALNICRLLGLQAEILKNI